MAKIAPLLKLAYDFEYDFKMARKQYSEPKIYDAGGDLSKRWYVYYSFRNPATGKLERQTPIYDEINSHKTVSGRRRHAKVVRNAVASVLEQGLYNPFADPSIAVERKREMGIAEAAEFVIRLKSRQLEATSLRGFSSRVNQFRDWLLENGYRDRYISSVTKGSVVDHLNMILERSSARNRNNSRVDLSTFFAVLKDNLLVRENIVEGIAVMKSVPTRNKSFTLEQEEKLLAKIFERHPHLGLYILFISVAITRCIEVNRLRVRDVDTRARLIHFKAKNSPLKTKIIPEMLLRELPDLGRLNPDAFLFGRNGIGQEWDATETSRQTYYGDMFAKILRELKMGPEYTLYSFRHTAITKIYRSLRGEGKPPFQAKSELMLITGHSTMKALESYLRQIDAELPEDFSHHLKTKSLPSPGGQTTN